MRNQKHTRSNKRSRDAKKHNDRPNPPTEDNIEDLSLEDQELIIEDVGGIPDRDQMFGVDHKTLPSGEVQNIRTQWTGDRENEIKGERESGPYQAELAAKAKTLLGVTPDNSLGDSPIQLRSTRPFLAKPGGAPFDYEDFSDEELLDHADILGIPGRENMPRADLIRAIKDLEQAS
ncbi:MAG: hypothetical protein AB7T49_07450 [Oligoflexales bacterium]